MINETLRNQHMDTITSAEAIYMYDQLCAACDRREGGVTDADQMLIADCARAEDIKMILLADIKKRGVGREKYNGCQSYFQKNSSIPALTKFSDHQRKIMAELRLTPSARKAESIPLSDGFDDD